MRVGGAALALAKRGARVCLCESLRYPGGCASTFSKDGARFDAGATLVSGLLGWIDAGVTRGPFGDHLGRALIH